MRDSDDSPSFGGALRRCRLSAGLTQESLAERSGVAKRTLQDLERGVARPRQETIRRLIAVLDPPPETRAQFEAAISAPRGGHQRTHRYDDAAPPAAGSPGQPLRLTSFIGREHQLDQVQQLLQTCRLLTLTGAGGSGKTRLALELADRLAQTYADGVFVVSLAAIAAPSLVASSVAQVLGIQEVAGEPLPMTLARRIGTAKMLLILDNFEHILPAGPLLIDLLATCPQLTVLVTSREVLRLRGEQAYPVPPLTVPTPGGPSADDQAAVASVLESEAGQLFVDRARSAQPSFRLDAQNAPAVAEICRRLDGLPLALELAAARTRYLTPESLRDRLEHRLQLLTGGARDGPVRQHTLRAAIAWSYDLLSEPEQRLFRRLAIFAGGFTLSAAEAVAAAVHAPEDPGPDTLEVVGSLVEKSLLLPMETPDCEPRFTMLETIREYALEQLAASSELPTLQRRHTEHFLAVAEQAAPHLRLADAAIWLDCLQAEHDNLRAALAWVAAHQDVGHLLPRLAASLWQFWWMRAYFAEGRRWLNQALAEPSDPVYRTTMLYGAGQLAFFQDDNARAGEFWSALLSIGRATGDQMATIQGLGRLSYLASRLGGHDQAVALADEGVVLGRRSGDDDGLREALHARALVAVGLKDYRYAEALWEECLPLARELGPRFVIHVLSWLGRMASERSDLSGAMVLTGEAVELARQLGDKFAVAGALGTMMLAARRQDDHIRAAAIARERLSLNRELGNRGAVVNDLECLAWAARAYGDPAQGARLLGLTEALRDGLHRHGSHLDLGEREREVEAIRLLLDPTAFKAAWTEGQAMTFEQGIVYALS